MARYTDEDFQAAPTPKKVTGAAFLSQAEMAAQSRKAIERDIVKLIAKEFRLDLRAIGEAVKNETTAFDYLMLGLNRAYAPSFPATIHVAKPNRGAGQQFSLARLLRHPEKYSLVGHFLDLARENLKLDSRPVILTGLHPRLGLLVVTDMKMEVDRLCFHFALDSGENKPLIVAAIKPLLRAMNRQGLWQPEVR